MARSRTRSFRHVKAHNARDVVRVGFAKQRANPDEGTMFVEWRRKGRNKIYYYAGIARHEYRRLEALARAGMLFDRDVLWLRHAAKGCMVAAPEVRKVWRK